MATNLNPERSEAVRSPKAVLSTSREEFYGQDTEHEPLELIVKEGLTDKECKLPDDLQGHVFIVGAVGYVNSYKPNKEEFPNVVQPSHDGWTHLFNGEGMIYRLDFHQSPQTPTRNEPKEEIGKAWITTRIAKTPDYYADVALENNHQYKELATNENELKYKNLKFLNFGITRLSIALGSRNYLNTAFLPMKFSDGSERLLVTWDAGRPYEVDACTLELIAPIGWNKQWYPLSELVQNLLHHPFPLVLSAAHPAFDTHTNEMFTVNTTKSLHTLLWISRLLSFDAKEFADRFIKIPIVKKIFILVAEFYAQRLDLCFKLLERILEFLGLDGRDAVYLNRWQGSSTSVEQWEVFWEQGFGLFKIQRPIKIQQSMHQMGLSKDYVLLSDSAFKLPLEDLIPYLNSQNPKLLETTDRSELLAKIREYLSYPELPDTYLYIIPRYQLKQHGKKVKAKRVKITPETAHFIVEYDNPNGKITLFCAHTAASDPAEFIHVADESYYKDPQLTQALRERSGMVVDGMDVSRLGCWVIDAEKGTCDPPVFVSDSETEKYLWSLSIFAWQGFQPNQFTDIYCNCWGSWPELLSQFIFEMYKDYNPQIRMVPVEKMVNEVIKKGKPANLFRLHVDRQPETPPKLTIKDSYNFPTGYFGNSPQFVPRQNINDPTDGYLVCVVIHSDNLLSDKSELWIFDSKNLSAGPRYRLSHPKLNMGVTIHTAWLSKLETPPAREDYSVRQDYEELVQKTGSQEIATLFEQDVYPHFE